jgi:hypothetical protein
MNDAERRRLIKQLQEDKAATEQDIADRVARLEADPIAMADDLAASHSAFIRRMGGSVSHRNTGDALVYKDAMVTAGATIFDDPAFLEGMEYVVDTLRNEFASGDRLLRQRISELEAKVAELTEQLSLFNRVADVAQQALNAWIKQSK